MARARTTPRPSRPRTGLASPLGRGCTTAGRRHRHRAIASLGGRRTGRAVSAGCAIRTRLSKRTGGFSQTRPPRESRCAYPPETPGAPPCRQSPQRPILPQAGRCLSSRCPTSLSLHAPLGMALRFQDRCPRGQRPEGPCLRRRFCPRRSSLWSRGLRVRNIKPTPPIHAAPGVDRFPYADPLTDTPVPKTKNLLRPHRSAERIVCVCRSVTQDPAKSQHRVAFSNYSNSLTRSSRTTLAGPSASAHIG
ncbi:hypothetical protein C8N38_106193 [Rhodovulum kholense]|uniref:Uncharacterized protein n=1 Tax=Rhodovulum kholense TaxID=453584 RepID=A0A8E2VLU0_9RHOB|nr:hypothetical protein C8N38_106193 [Rhodovulum kholense]